MQQAYLGCFESHNNCLLYSLHIFAKPDQRDQYPKFMIGIAGVAGLHVDIS